MVPTVNCVPAVFGEVIVEIPNVAPTWVEELPASTRGESGFGSTGTR